MGGLLAGRVTTVSENLKKRIERRYNVMPNIFINGILNLKKRIESYLAYGRIHGRFQRLNLKKRIERRSATPSHPSGRRSIRISKRELKVDGRELPPREKP